MTTSTDSTNLAIKKDEYAAFDALSLKDFINARLTQSGIFTDQNYEGSNITAVNNIIAYSFHTLLYYLNQTSTESMFSEAQLYENMNRIVKLISYSPIGSQTSTLSFSVSATAGLPVGTYTIPRYTFIRSGNSSYSFNTDITFTKTLTGVQFLETVGDQYLLYQGSYIEYPLYTARGEANEIVFLIPGEDVIVDHFNIDVYVKSINTGLWTKWTRTESLYLENATAEKYEVRLNQNKNYELKFGDDINGVQLTAGDIVAIYFLQSAGSSGEVGAEAINGQSAVLYTTTQFDQIKPEVISSDLTLLTDVSILNLQFANTNISTTFTDAETVDSIRTNAPSTFKTQFRTVTTSDYEIFVKNNFANIINDVKVLNNNSYTNEHLRYLYDIGLTNPGQDYRVLYNQMAFADACNFNNVYVYVLPKATKLITNNYVNYLTPAQKQLIISTLNDKKTLTSEVIIMDPVYKAVTIGLGENAVDLADITSSRLRIILQRSTKVPASVIKSQVQGILETYFNPIDITLGFTVSVTDIASEILALNGVKEVQTVNGNLAVNGVSFIVYNPSYPQNDITSTTKNFTVQTFQTVYLDNIDEIMTRVEVVPEVNQDTSIINF
jgi:phosphotransferase system IIB component